MAEPFNLDAHLAHWQRHADHPRAAETTIYFIADGTAVKIGITDAGLYERICGLQVGNPRPLNLIGWYVGPRGLEDDIHERFWEARIRGEWFTIIPELSALIERLNALRSEARLAADREEYERRVALYSVGEAPRISFEEWLVLQDDAA